MLLSDMAKLLCLAHGRDVDGIGCHAILHRYGKLKGLEMGHSFADYDKFCRCLKEIPANGAEVVIADLGYNKAFSECIDLLESLSVKNEVKWFDHHDWAGIKLDLPIEFVISSEVCAAELIQKRYLPEDGIAKEIASISHAHDFREEHDLAWRLYEVISSGYDKLKLVEALSEGNYWNRELEEAYRVYQRVKEEGFSYLDEHSKLYKVGGWTCLIGFSPDALGSTLASDHLLEKNTDFVICIWGNGKMSFRRNAENINLVGIASIFDGGGREEAAGGFYHKPVDERNYLKIFEEIMERLSMIYGKINESRY